jgi:hypothetical protein
VYATVFLQTKRRSRREWRQRYYISFDEFTKRASFDILSSLKGGDSYWLTG